MAVVVNIHDSYKKAVKKARLKPNDQLEVLDEVSNYPERGDSIAGAGILRKLRVKFLSKRTGKSGGLRVVYYYDEERSEAWLLYVYYKSDKENLTPQEVKRLEQLAKSLSQSD